MAYHISRDYSPAASPYVANKVHVNFMYELSVFLNKILGYSVVGQTGWDINNTDIKSLSISAATNATPIQVTTATHGLTTGQVVFITGGTGNTGVNGTFIVTVLNGTQFTLNGSVGNGTYNAGTATMTTGFQYASGFVSDGYGTGINFGAGSYVISIPLAKRTVVAGDIGKMIVMKSSANPTKNSGLFKISAVDTVNNRYTIDYRSTDTPPAEAVNTIDWWLYEIETIASNYITSLVTTTFTVTAASNASPIQITTSATNTLTTGQVISIVGALGNTAANGTWTVTVINGTNFTLNGSTGNGVWTSGGTVSYFGYNGDGASINSRVILQSPHATGWQVRIASEPTTANLPVTSVSVGYGGNAAGDFPIGGNHTHVSQFLDANPTGGYANATLGGANATVVSRATIVGDDTGQAVVMYSRVAAGTGSPGVGLLILGIPDNEPVPNYPNSERIFMYGSSSTTDFGTIQARFNAGFNAGMTVRSGVPEICAITGWANLDGTTGTSPIYSANAGDSPFTTTTEILPFEVWGGVSTDIALAIPQPSSTVLFTYNQRFMGTAPFIRTGRTNFGNFTLSTDAGHAWLHLQNGIYLQWNGAGGLTA